MMSDAYWKQPLKWNKRAAYVGVHERVFCASMADVFEDHPDVNEPRFRLWKLIEDTPMLDWLLLTKRPENIDVMLPFHWNDHSAFPYANIPDNVWLGVSAENQDEFDGRWPVLESVGRATGAKVLFLSLEPLLGPIDIEGAFEWEENDEYEHHWTRGVDWIIVGGESGPECRPMELDWARSIRDQCREQEIPFFFKQVGGTRKIGSVAGGDLLDGVCYHEFPGDAPTPITELPQQWQQGRLL